MFKGFDLKIDPATSLFDKYLSTGRELHSEHKKSINTKLSEFVTSSGGLSAKKMKESWFPEVEAQIFISHSHQDLDLAIGLAGCLKDVFDLTAFVDYSAWGNARALLKSIDEIYCYSDETKKTFDYQKRNFSTSHIHMMLATSLSMMIDKCECLFFINSPSSVTARQATKATPSPWIFYEIATTQLIRPKTRAEHREPKELLEKSLKNSLVKAHLTIDHEVDLSHLEPLNYDDLYEWNQEINDDEHALDTLYRLKKII